MPPPSRRHLLLGAGGDAMETAGLDRRASRSHVLHAPDGCSRLRQRPAPPSHDTPPHAPPPIPRRRPHVPLSPSCRRSHPTVDRRHVGAQRNASVRSPRPSRLPRKPAGSRVEPSHRKTPSFLTGTGAMHSDRRESCMRSPSDPAAPSGTSSRSRRTQGNHRGTETQCGQREQAGRVRRASPARIHAPPPVSIHHASGAPPATRHQPRPIASGSHPSTTAPHLFPSIRPLCLCASVVPPL